MITMWVRCCRLILLTFVSFRTANGRPLLFLVLCEKSLSDMHHNGFDSVLFVWFVLATGFVFAMAAYYVGI